MIIIHTEPNSTATPTRMGSLRGGGSTSDSSDSIRIIRPHRKDWVRFDSEEEDELRNIQIEKESNTINLQVDMNRFDTVEINFVKKFNSKEGSYNHQQQTECTRKKFFSSEVLKQNLEILTHCGFYYQRRDYDAETCTKLLSKTAPGTFLVRDSSDPNYIFTLSLQTERGPTSVRLVFIEGKFRLDAADQRLIGALPGFKNVVQLVQYYVRCNSNNGSSSSGKKSGSSEKSGNRQVWIDSTTGRTHSTVKLIKPLRHTVPSLLHLSRIALNKSSCDTTNLPDSVKRYLNSYPFVL